MKVLFIGNNDILAAGLLERLNKEGNDVYLLDNDVHKTAVKGLKKYKVFHMDSVNDIHEVFQSINPESVVFAGWGFMDEVWGREKKENLAVLAGVLEECRLRGSGSVALLSSTEVYGDGVGDITESTPICPATRKATWLSQCESMLKNYHEYHGVGAVILRLGAVFGKTIDTAANDRLANLLKADSNGVQDAYLQPVHVSDVADAVVRVLATGESGVYNVCSSYQTKISDLVPLLGSSLKVFGAPKNGKISNDKLKKEQEWVDFWKIEDLLKEKKIAVSSGNAARSVTDENKSGWGAIVRRFLENLVLFALFTAAYVLSHEHQLFSQVHWLLIYVMVVSLFYGVRQGALSVLLASAAYLTLERGNIFQMTNFYSFVENVLVILEFIFFGIVVGYTADELREQNRVQKQVIKELQKAHARLQDINRKNLLIKNEYEKRLLESKNSIPRLYSIINRINALDTDRILTEVLHVVEELMQTNTVAVYKANTNSKYLRLIVALNEESLMEARSWNLTEYPHIRAAINSNELYEGDIWKNEPAIVLPVPYSQSGSAVVVIKKVALEKMSLYYINMLRTVLLMVSGALERAFQYDIAMREQRYLGDTEIMYPHEFSKAIVLAEEKMRKQLAEYTLLKIGGEGTVEEKFRKAAGQFRELDHFGVDKNGDLFVLLNNSSRKDETAVLERLTKNGIEARVVQEFQAGDNK